MCGIFGAVDSESVTKTMQALHFLEYRGYDSAGISVKNEKLQVYKTVGRVSALESQIQSGIFGKSTIGHTRWATHGSVCYENAHPFLSQDGNFAICHNGVIENHQELRTYLINNGYSFASTTDSEVVAHLLQHNYKGDVLQTVLQTAKMLKGAFAVLIQTLYDDNLYAIKYKSPLMVGASNVGSYLCSDVRCIASYAEKVAVVPDNTVVVASQNQLRFLTPDKDAVTPKFFTPETPSPIDKQTPVSDTTPQTGQPPQTDKMLSEIYEIPERVRQAKQGYFDTGGIGISASQLRKFTRIYFLGCGTAYNSGLEIAAVARNFLGVELLPVIASEFVYDKYPVDKRTLAFCISQSGETADTIRAAEKVNSLGGYTYAVTNTDLSSLCFVCRKVKNVFAGGEFAVASTKAYNCQLVTLLLLVMDIAYSRGTLPDRQDVWEAMDQLPLALEQILAKQHKIVGLADQIKDSSAIFFVGRTTDFPTATEGSLKLKEISYIHSEAYPSGELKHGTLALMEKGVSVIVLSTSAELVEKNNTSAQEIASRNATVITVSQYKGNGLQITLPIVHRYLYGIVSVLPLQLLAYFVAKGLNRDVDKPRNLAKSVTVE